MRTPPHIYIYVLSRLKEEDDGGFGSGRDGDVLTEAFHERRCEVGPRLYAFVVMTNVGNALCVGLARVAFLQSGGNGDHDGILGHSALGRLVRFRRHHGHVLARRGRVGPLRPGVGWRRRHGVQDTRIFGAADVGGVAALDSGATNMDLLGQLATQLRRQNTIRCHIRTQRAVRAIRNEKRSDEP